MYDQQQMQRSVAAIRRQAAHSTAAVSSVLSGQVDDGMQACPVQRGEFSGPAVRLQRLECIIAAPEAFLSLTLRYAAYRPAVKICIVAISAIMFAQ